MSRRDRACPVLRRPRTMFETKEKGKSSSGFTKSLNSSALGKRPSSTRAVTVAELRAASSRWGNAAIGKHPFRSLDHFSHRPKIKRASEFFRIQDARAALPQNCSRKIYGVAENLRMALECQTESPKCHFVNHRFKERNPGSPSRCLRHSYSESTIAPGAVPVTKGEPVITVGTPVDGL
jgi:hypothetical protein